MLVFWAAVLIVVPIGMFHPGEALTVTPEDLRLMIDVNVLAVFTGTDSPAAIHAAAGSPADTAAPLGVIS